jgi:glycosyltransferase involved in cell wall biosynthesis
MNILLLSTHLNTGGITSYLLTLSKGLMNRGHHVHMAASGGNMEQDFLCLGAQVLSLNILTKSELDPRIYWALKPLKKYILEQDIQCVHSHTRITQVMGALLKKKTGRPFLTTCHGYFKNRLSRRWFPCWGDKVIAISKAVEDHLKNDFGVPLEKIVLIESGIDLDAFEPVTEELKIERRKRFGLGQEPVIGMVARLSDVKGQDILIKAMARVVTEVPEAKLLLVGMGKTESILRSMVSRLGLEEHIRFIALVNATNEMLSLFDIFVMPSRQEGLGLSIMEAQAAGVPVIASRVGGIPGLIEDGRTGILVEPENVQALSSAVIELIKSRPRSRAIGLSGRDFIQMTHSSDCMVEKTIAVYQNFVREG